MTKKQKIVLVVAGSLFVLGLFSSFSTELERATKQHYSDSMVVLINTFIGGIERIESPLGLICVGVLGSLFYRFKKPRDGGTEEDGYEMLSHATRLETQGRIQEAIAAYDSIASKYSHTTAGRDAQKSLESLRQKIR